MGVNWTAEQKKVIESRNRNLLVAAAAGSGKTAVLVERIIRMITAEDHPADIDRLLVMTFTRAAASEMRERIQAAIEEKLEENPGNAHLEQQAVLIQSAQITTIDSFCLHILREHFDCLDIDPAFRVADEGEMLLMRADVMEELLEDSYEKGGAFERFVDTYAVGKADGGIEDYIEQVYTFSQSNPWPDQWIRSCREEWMKTGEDIIRESAWMKYLLRDVTTQLSEWCRQLEEAKALCEEEDGPAAYLPMIEEDMAALQYAVTKGDDYRELCRALSLIQFSRLGSIRAKDGVDPEKKERVSECRNTMKKAVGKIRSEYLFESPEQAAADMENSREGVLVLLDLAEEFAARLRERKKEKNIVDFGDLEHMALEVLTVQDENGERVPGPAADEMSRQFDEILVDEYQDSNLVQETLIHCISGERFGHPNVFMVGDVKQSIYKFRLARPELFMEKYDRYTEEDSLFQKIELHQNFRSRAEVLERINDIFYRIMTRKLGGISYTEEAALHPGASFEPREDTEELDTELLIADSSPDAAEGDEVLEELSAREQEALLIASRIREMTDPETGIRVWDKEKKQYRRAVYSDIVILLRSMSGWAETFTEVLMQQGIPAEAESRTGYFTAPEVETVLNLLAVIDNPMQDIPLAAVLRSPMAGLSDQELAELSSAYRKSGEAGGDGGLWQAAVFYPKSENPDPVLEEKLLRVSEQVKEFRREAEYMPMHELLYDIYGKTGYYAYAAALPGGEVRRANLDMLAERAAAYESTSYRGVFHFIRYIEKLKKYNSDFGEAAPAEGVSGAVRIFSIHKSKGLEFPIVIAAGLGKQFNRQDTRGKLLIDSDLGIGTDYLDSERRIKGPTLKKNAMKQRMEQEALGEELRVLYVALTRAREKLILTAAVRHPEERILKWNRFSAAEGAVPRILLLQAACPLDWILMSLADGKSPLVPRCEAVSARLTEETGRQMDRLEAKADLLRRAGEKKEEPGNRFAEVFGFSYPFETDTRLNTKMSVSELKMAGMEEEEEKQLFEPSLPRFMEGTDEIQSGASRGTAYHRVMELLSYESGADESRLRAEIREMTEKGKIAPEAAERVYVPDLVRFLLSPLGQRMERAAGEGTLRREQQFVMGIPAGEMGDFDSDERILIQGIIDAFFEEDGKLVLVDYKTDAVKLPQQLIDRYRVQLAYYTRALEQITGKQVKEAILYSFRFGEVKLKRTQLELKEKECRA